jgi:hypothetical protein
MVEKKEEPEKQAEPRQTSSQESETKRVADLLTSILNEVRKQVQSETPKPLEGAALEAVAQFKEIGAALDLQNMIKLVADPNHIKRDDPKQTTLRWESSTSVTRVSLKSKSLEEEKNHDDLKPPTEKNHDDLKPPTGPGSGATSGAVPIAPVDVTTIFTATAVSPCGTATATAMVTVEGSVIVIL